MKSGSCYIQTTSPQTQPARKRNGNLPEMGGVFNYVNLHVYHYAGNNPVVYRDTDGNETVIFSLTVTPWNRHLFIAVRDNDGNITTKSLYPRSQAQAVIDVITGGTQENVITENKPDEYSAAEAYFNNNKMPFGIRMEARIEVPNNNTYVDDVIEKSGGRIPDIEKATQQNRGE